MASNQSHNNQYLYVYLFQYTTLIWPNIYCLNTSYNHLIINLLRHFHLQTCSIYIFVMVCLGNFSDNKYNFFLNALLGHSRKVINFVHSCMINIFQAKKSQIRKNNLEKYISPFPRLNIINIPNFFVKKSFVGILMNYADNMVDLRTFRIRKSLFSAKNTSVYIVKYWDFDLKMDWGLWYIP